MLLLSCSLIFSLNINPFIENYEFSGSNNSNRKLINKPIANVINSTSINNYDTSSSIFSHVIEYDLLSMTESIGEDSGSAKEKTTHPSIPPSIDLIENEYIPHPKGEFSDLKTAYPFPPDDREKITSTSSYPWSTICKLFITAENGSEYIGSGFIVDEFHILTCGHCIYIHESGGWVDEVEVVPGMDGAYEPFGSAYATYFRTSTRWTDDEMEEHDWALVTLDRNIGSLTGWMGIQTDSFTSPIYTGTLHTAGYPGDINNGYSMYYDSDSGEDADEYSHWYWMDTAGGQSGSPVWLEDEQGDPYVLSIHAYEYENGEYANMGTRINDDKFDQIISWLEEDSPSAPVDKAELLDVGYYSNISTTSVFSGETIFSIYCDVKNEGTATASSFKVNYYASVDSLITTTDYLIGTTIIYDLDPFEYMSADWSGIFPANITDGYYYIGWIIDADNEIDELDESNNIVFDVSFYIEVETRDTFDPMVFIFIPVIIAIAVIIVVVAVGIILMKRKSSKAKPPYKPSLESIQQQKYPTTHQEIIKFCPNCGKSVISQTQRFCITCGSDLSS